MDEKIQSGNANDDTIDESEEIEAAELEQSLKQHPHELNRVMQTLSRRNTGPKSLKNPFDPSEPGWKLERALKAAVVRSNAEGSHPNLLKSSVRWRNVNVFGEGATARSQPTVSSFLLDCFRAVSGIFGRSSERQILHDFDGLLNEGEMLLVLGLPGSGCSTLLRTLSGHDEGFSKWSGDITYNGVPVEVMKKDFRGKVVLNEEDENHFPHLTVAQTLEFAIKTKTPRKRIGGVSRQQYIETMRNILGATFGLTHTFQTRVGNDYIRGVSGGERRRVSLAEMLATCPSVTYWDNPTRGLDSSTSLEFAGALRAATNLTNTVAVAALYQPGDSLVDVFDKVTILHEGHQIFFGELAAAKEYFQELGFVFHPRQTTAEFLLSVTDPGSRRIRAGYEHTAPRTIEDLMSSWKSSKHYKQFMSEMADHGDLHPRGHSESIGSFKKTQNAEKAPLNRSKSPYTINWGMQFLSTYLRSCQRIVSDKAYTLSIVVTMGVIALLIGSMYYDIPEDTSGYFSKGGCVFFSVLFNILVNFVEISSQFSQRQIVAKHKAYAMYHPSIDALASMIAQYPIKFVNVAVFSVVVYFMVGFKREPGAFFVFLLVLFLVSVTMSALFRTIAALVNRVEIALAIAGIILLVLAIYAGYVIPRPSMHPWFKWLSYINPIYYAVESIMVMEFHHRESPCATLVPSGPGYENVNIANQVCASEGAIPGERYALGDSYIETSFAYSYSHLWRNVGISIAFFIFFFFTFAAATELKNPPTLKGGQLLFQDKGNLRPRPPRQHDMEQQSQHQCREDTHAPPQESTLMQNLTRSDNVFTWQGVTYDIDVKGENRRLLSGVQGYVKPGEMTALMGESGAGKTTLLNLLAQRVSTGIILGHMLVNGRRLGHSFQRGTGYVQQQDVHFEEATVREAFRFSAFLRQPRDVPLEEKYVYVEKVIDALGMHDYAGAVIGTPGRGLSAEQRKRTTIGLELVAKPSILLFLDEPTSGLDSRSAISIVKLLRSLANAGQAILCTIHQPSSLLFEEFDRLLLLVKGGKTAYFGDVGDNSSTVLSYFERNGGYPCPEHANPAEYILDVVGAGATAQSSQDWAETWNDSPEELRNTNEIQSLIRRQRERGTGSDDASDKSHTIYALPWIQQYLAVQQRLFAQYWRSPVYVVSKIAINTIGGLFLGFTFFKQNSSVAGLKNSIFSVFMLLLLSLVILVQLQPRLIQYRNLYEVREKHSKMYSWTVFIAASIATEIPYNIVIASVCFVCWYLPVGWWRTISAGRGAFMWLVFMVYQLYHTTFSQAVAIAAPDAETASMVTILFYTFIFAFTGVVQPLAQLVGFWHFAYYVSPFTYVVASMMSSMSHDIPVRCSEVELSLFNPPSGQTCGEYAGAFANASMATLSNPNATENCEYCQYAVSDVFLEGFNIRYSERWHHFGYLWAFIAFNACLFYGIYYLVFQGGGAKIGWMFSGVVSNKAKAKSADGDRESR